MWGSPKSKNVDYKVEHPVFSKDKNGNINISYIDQFPEPQNIGSICPLTKVSIPTITATPLSMKYFGYSLCTG